MHTGTQRRVLLSGVLLVALVYVSTALGQVAALDAGTGETVWTYDPRIYDYMERPPNMGWRHRGLTYWQDSESDDARIFMANHDLRLARPAGGAGWQPNDVSAREQAVSGSGRGHRRQRGVAGTDVTRNAPVPHDRGDRPSHERRGRDR